MKRVSVVFAVSFVLAMVLSACSSVREQTFKDVPGNSRVLVHDKTKVGRAVIASLAEKGFQSESSNDGNLIKSKKYAKDGKTTCVTTLNCYLFDLGNDTTKVQVTASEETSETSGHVKYFWLLFIPIPYGSYDTTAVTGVETVYDKTFYAEFFGRVEKNLESSFSADKTVN